MHALTCTQTPFLAPDEAQHLSVRLYFLHFQGPDLFYVGLKMWVLQFWVLNSVLWTQVRVEVI